MKKEILEILISEVKPALGCTAPVSVGLVAAVAQNAVGGTPKSLRLISDINTYKNSIAVVTPGTSFTGVLEPACVGAFYGDSSLGMEVFQSVEGCDEAFIRKFAKENATVELAWDYKGAGLYLEAYVETEKGSGHAVIANAHDHVVLIEVDGKPTFQDESFHIEDLSFDTKAPIRAFSVEDLYHFSQEVELPSIAFLKDAIDMNLKLSQAGSSEQMGGRFGIGLLAIPGDPMVKAARALAAAASDARMSGKNLSAMSCAKSGNVGIAASIPLVPIAQELGKSEEELLRAVCLSYLMTIYIKSHIGRLSAMCACAIAASIGVGCGCCLLLGTGMQGITATIKNIVGSIGGILCDGAKFGCAMKLSTATGVAIDSARLAMQGIEVPDGDGLVCYSADETIAMLGELASHGMVETGNYMTRQIIARENSRDGK